VAEFVEPESSSAREGEKKIKSAFATLVEDSLASPTWPGLSRPVSSAATSHVCAPEPNELSANENVFVRKTGNK
jgi:hypothetical protein